MTCGPDDTSLKFSARPPASRYFVPGRAETKAGHMIRRAALALALITALVGLLSTEAVALRGRHSTQITITSSDISGGEAIVEGNLTSSYRNCTRYRRVGLFVGN